MIYNRREQVGTYIVRNSQTAHHVRCARIGGSGTIETNTDNSTNCYDNPCLAVSKSFRHLLESRNHRHVIATLSRAQVVTPGAA